MDAKQINEILEKSKSEIDHYLEKARDEGRIDDQLFTDAKKHVYENLKLWLECPQVDSISLAFKDKIAEDIRNKKYDRIVNAFRQEVRFGTGGIRGMMAFDKRNFGDIVFQISFDFTIFGLHVNSQMPSRGLIFDNTNHIYGDRFTFSRNSKIFRF